LFHVFQYRAGEKNADEQEVDEAYGYVGGVARYGDVLEALNGAVEG
jgi:hypothetical protein